MYFCVSDKMKTLDQTKVLNFENVSKLLVNSYKWIWLGAVGDL